MEINDLTHKIIGCAYKVHNVLGFGFIEKCYENALKIEMDKLGIHALQQDKVNVWYEDHLVGFFVPDLWLPETLIIEVKSVQNIPKEYEVMLVNYLTATKINDGLLINFGPSVQVKRKFREYKPKGSLIDALMRESRIRLIGQGTNLSMKHLIHTEQNHVETSTVPDLCSRFDPLLFGLSTVTSSNADPSLRSRGLRHPPHHNQDT